MSGSAVVAVCAVVLVVREACLPAMWCDDHELVITKCGAYCCLSD